MSRSFKKWEWKLYNPKVVGDNAWYWFMNAIPIRTWNTIKRSLHARVKLEEGDEAS